MHLTSVYFGIGVTLIWIRYIARTFLENNPNSSKLRPSSNGIESSLMKAKPVFLPRPPSRIERITQQIKMDGFYISNLPEKSCDEITIDKRRRGPNGHKFVYSHWVLSRNNSQKVTLPTGATPNFLRKNGITARYKSIWCLLLIPGI